MLNNIAALLKEGANPALRYHTTTTLAEDLAQAIVKCFEDDADLRSHLPLLRSLITDYDYRLVAEYLCARQLHDTSALSIISQIAASNDREQAGRLYYQLAHNRFARRVPLPTPPALSVTHQLEDIFRPATQQLVLYLHSNQHTASLLELLATTGAELGSFIEQQYDVPGLNSVVRQGIIRKWSLPDGTAVISKRENPHKEGRFQREQFNYRTLLRQFGEKPVQIIDSERPQTELSMRIALPFAVVCDGYTCSRYALFSHAEGRSLEDILLIEDDSVAREGYLKHYRLLLDHLYEGGILWGDMSPRNILVQQTEDSYVYTLLDFEKTTIITAPVSLAQRIEHCRGQICVEELGVLCSLNEVMNTFKDYFMPHLWDLEADISLPFAPRPDVAAVLQGRGVKQVTLGAYNKLDREFMSVRLPDQDPMTQSRRYPGHIGFKVEHYLSCADNTHASDYERKTTEILIAAKQHGCFDQVVRLLTQFTSSVEGAFLQAEFLNMLRGGFSGNVPYPIQEVQNLTSVINRIYSMFSS